MDKLIVQGGADLSGRINISGSKNSSLPILAATLLTEEACIVRNVPDVSDTNYLIQIMNAIGGHVERSSGTVRIEAANIHHEAPYDLVRKMRASICVMGPLLGRLGKAKVSLPGGCVIGDRPIDLHLKGFEALGAEITMDGGDITVEAPNGLTGAHINLRGKHGPTVLGTDNVMMAATLAKGTTVIESAACEPEVYDLAEFLNAMGAKISGHGTRTITIEGVEKLHGVDHTVIPDRIEAATFMVAGIMASTSGITLRRVRRDHLTAAEEMLLAAGHTVEFNEQGTEVFVKKGDAPKGCEIITAPYPGFPTDMQAQFTAMLALTPGISVVEDTIFPQRFMQCSELKRMGANIEVDNGRAVVHGVGQLSGAPVMASDLRASAALVLAGLKASGETEISRLYHIDRGYEHIDEKLEMLGATVTRVPDHGRE